MRLSTTSGTLATMQLRWMMCLGCVICLALACGADSNERTEPPPQQPEPVVEQREETAIVPARIRVVNDTEETLVLDRSYGPASPLGVVALGPGGERPLSLDQEDDDQSQNFVATCECRCSARDCAECEPPQEVLVTLAPGDDYTFMWNGKLRRRRTHRLGMACWTTILAQPGAYVFSACTESGRCGRVEVTLPTSSIEIRLSQQVSMDTCDRFDAQRSWAVRGRVLDQLQYALRDRPLDACNRVACVSAEELDAELEAAREQACTVFIVPRGHEIEGRVFLPLPEGTNGGESYSHFFDPDLTTLLRAPYEQ